MSTAHLLSGWFVLPNRKTFSHMFLLQVHVSRSRNKQAVNIRSRRLAIIGRKAALPSVKLADPPVLVGISLLDNLDPVSLPEREVPGSLTLERVLSHNILLRRLVTLDTLWWRRWRRLLLDYGTAAVRTAIADGVAIGVARRGENAAVWRRRDRAVGVRTRSGVTAEIITASPSVSRG